VKPLDPFDRVDSIREGDLARLAATLDVHAPAQVPALWHWTSFLERSTTASLGPDGHPRGSGLVTDPPYPRRMFAGGRMRLEQPLPVEQPIRRIARVGPIVEKHGSRGPLAIVTIFFDYFVGDACVATEEQDLVYLPSEEPTVASGGAPPISAGAIPGPSADRTGGDDDSTRGGPAGDGAVISVTTSFSEVTLFRFSALTFNSHRIHYDRSYAVGIEGHQDLVVHGPLLIIRLLDLLRGPLGDDAVSSLEFRAKSPTYVGRPVTFEARIDDDSAALVAREGPRILMEAKAGLR
jgi:3-methylfumaryl-CoA hydratase